MFQELELRVFTRGLIDGLDEDVCNLVNGADWPWLGDIITVLETARGVTIESTRDGYTLTAVKARLIYYAGLHSLYG